MAVTFASVFFAGILPFSQKSHNRMYLWNTAFARTMITWCGQQDSNPHASRQRNLRWCHHSEIFNHLCGSQEPLLKQFRSLIWRSIRHFANECLYRSRINRNARFLLCKVTNCSYLWFRQLTVDAFLCYTSCGKCWNVTGSAGLTNSIRVARGGGIG